MLFSRNLVRILVNVVAAVILETGILLNYFVWNWLFFKDEEQRQKLNRITHPEIYKEMTWEVSVNDFARLLSFTVICNIF